jgi:hypothetical protein
MGEISRQRGRSVHGDRVALGSNGWRSVDRRQQEQSERYAREHDDTHAPQH